MEYYSNSASFTLNPKNIRYDSGKFLPNSARFHFTVFCLALTFFKSRWETEKSKLWASSSFFFFGIIIRNLRVRSHASSSSFVKRTSNMRSLAKISISNQFCSSSSFLRFQNETKAIHMITLFTRSHLFLVALWNAQKCVSRLQTTNSMCWWLVVTVKSWGSAS